MTVWCGVLMTLVRSSTTGVALYSLYSRVVDDWYRFASPTPAAARLLATSCSWYCSLPERSGVVPDGQVLAGSVLINAFPVLTPPRFRQHFLTFNSLSGLIGGSVVSQYFSSLQISVCIFLDGFYTHLSSTAVLLKICRVL